MKTQSSRRLTLRSLAPASRSGLHALAATALAAGLAACGDSSGPPDPPGPVPVAAVEVAGAVTTVEVGGLLQLTATARDAQGNVLAGRMTIWSSTNQGVATVTSAGLVNGVAVGNATINATVEGVSGGIQLAVTAPPAVVLSAISPATLVPGQSAILTGSGFSTVPAANAVRVGGTPATVTAASAMSLTITVPSGLCAPPGPVEVIVTVSGRTSNPMLHPAQIAGTAVTAARGEMQFLNSGFCLQFAASAASDTFLIGVQNYSEDVANMLPLTVAMAAASPAAVLAWEAGVPAAAAQERPGFDPARALRWAKHRQAELALRRTERSIPIRNLLPARPAGQVDAAAAIPAVVNVGDSINIRVPDRTSAETLCSQYTQIKTVVRHVGAKSVWLEDTGNPAGGLSVTDYQNLANTFDNQIFATLVDYFGQPSDIDGNGRIVIVITKEVNRSDILGFTTTADVSNCPSSDNGEIYYTRAVDPAGQFGDAYDIAEALIDAPQLLAHEGTHISQFTRRIMQPGFTGPFQNIWEMEGQATFAEEVVGHTITGRAPSRNYAFDVAWDCVDTDPCVDPSGIAWYAGGFVDMALYFGFDPNATDPRTIPIPNAPEQCSWLNLPANGNSGPCYKGREVYGVPWLLLRYLSDQYGPQFAGGEKELHRRMIEGSRRGFDNVQNLIGRPMDRVLAEWAAALYVDDRLAGMDPRLTFTSWNLFSIQGHLVTPARLRPRAFTFGSFSETVSVRAGSTAYFLISGARGTAALRVRGAGESIPPSNIRVWAVRLQ